MSASPSAEKITVRNLYKVFGRNASEAMELARQGLTKDEIFEKTGHILAVRDASFTVNEGEIFVVMGLSGSGKSTLVRMLNRLIEPSAGRVTVNGHDLMAMHRRELIAFRRREIAMVFQSFALMPHLTSLENAAFGLNVAGVREPERTERAMKSLETVGLSAYAQSYPEELSGGMQQRVGLARALALDPSIMLMDEAFSALDPLIRTEMQDELMRIQQDRGLTVVFISHDIDEAIRIGDRIAIMADGAVCQVGSPEEIIANPADDYVRSFFREVDVSKVLTASDIARREETIIVHDGVDNPDITLEILRRQDRAFGYVQDRGGHFLGVVSADSLAASHAKHGTLKDAFLEGVEAVPGASRVGDLLGNVAQTPYPVPVVDSSGRFSGTISRAALLLALEHREEST